MFLSSAIITVHLENLRHNLKTLLARHPSLMPVIKADAYGHGVVAVARVLAEEGIQHMAVGSVGEGALLRQEGHTAFLLALMGLARDEDTALAASYDITPLVHSRESLERILAQSHLTGRAKPLTVAIKFDTGMSRLGFRVDEAAELADYLRTLGYSGTRRFHPRTGAPLPRSDGKHEGRFPGPQNIPDKLSGPPLLAELRRRSGQTRRHALRRKSASRHG